MWRKQSIQTFHHKNHNIRLDNKYFKTVAEIKYFGTAVSNPNFIHKEIMSRLNSWNALNILTSHLLSKNKRINIYKTIIWHAVLYLFIYGLFNNTVNSTYYDH
jgi:hypothetical protein